MKYPFAEQMCLSPGREELRTKVAQTALLLVGSHSLSMEYTRFSETQHAVNENKGKFLVDGKFSNKLISI